MRVVAALGTLHPVIAGRVDHSLTIGPPWVHSRATTAVEVTTNYIAAMSSGDFESGFGYFADDVVGDMPGRSSLAGQRRGRAAVEGYIRDVIAHTRGKVYVELLEMLVGDEHVALMVPEKLGDDEHRVEIRRVNVYRVKNDTIIEIRIFEGEQYAMDEFTGGVTSGQR